MPKQAAAGRRRRGKALRPRPRRPPGSNVPCCRPVPPRLVPSRLASRRRPTAPRPPGPQGSGPVSLPPLFLAHGHRLTDLGQAARPPAPGPAARRRRPPPQRLGGRRARPGGSPQPPTLRSPPGSAAGGPFPRHLPPPHVLPPTRSFVRPSFLPSVRPSSHPSFPPLPGAARAGHRSLPLRDSRPPPAPGTTPLGLPRRSRAAPTSRAAGAGPAAALTDLGARRRRSPLPGAARGGAGGRSGPGLPANPEGVKGRRRSELSSHAASPSPIWKGAVGAGGAGGGRGRVRCPSRGACVPPAASRSCPRLALVPAPPAPARAAEGRPGGSPRGGFSRRSCAPARGRGSGEGFPEGSGGIAVRAEVAAAVGRALRCWALAAGGHEQPLAPSPLSRGGPPVTGARRRRSRRPAWEETS